ncbi:MAG TPA: L,D-transpeptidase [Flavobacteriales bacterium]|nr:L,D-transpeptidase [Flavobacteriales bacterium]
MRTLIFALLIACAGCGYKYTGEGPGHSSTGSKLSAPQATVNLVKLVDSLKLNKNKIAVHIYKSAYKLKVKYDTLTLKTYACVFGFNARDDKLKEGDGCTPEGKFGIRAKYPHSNWSKFIWIDYPNASSWAKHKNAKKNGTLGSKESIGGEVGIHGVPDGYDYLIDERQNWTLGCISLKNKDVDELYAVLGSKSVVWIYH